MTGPVWHWVIGGLVHEMDHDSFIDAIRPFSPRPRVILRRMVDVCPLVWVTA